MTIQQEFQVVVLAAGRGSRMSEITAAKPKCLLPVGPRPLIWYTLKKLENSGFSDVIVIILESHRAEIQSEIEKTDLDLKIDYVSVPESNEDLGTADSLRLIHDRLKSDVLVVSSDFVSDVNLRNVLDVFRKHDASVASLLLHPQANENVVPPGPKSKYKPERDLIGVDQQTNRLVFQASTSDFESELPLPSGLLKKHPHIKIYSNLVDSHVYVLKNWVIAYLKNEESITSIKGELVPHIVRKQLSKATAKTVETNQSVVNSNDPRDDIFNYAKESELELMIRDLSSYNDHSGDMKNAYHDDPIRCYAYMPPKGTFGVRVNNLPTYWDINGKIVDKWAEMTNGASVELKSPKASVSSNQVDERCVVWEGAELKEKTSFKNSIIGANTKIDCFSRVFNSVVMNNVTIKEKVAIENCIVCDGVTIESGCQLKSCLIGSGHVVEENSQCSNQVLTETERLMHF